MITNAKPTITSIICGMRYGRIENFRVVQGAPMVDTETQICIEYKLSGVEQPLEVITEREFLNKPQVRAMLDKFRMVGDGIIECLDVRDGLPCKMTVRKNALN